MNVDLSNWNFELQEAFKDLFSKVVSEYLSSISEDDFNIGIDKNGGVSFIMCVNDLGVFEGEHFSRSSSICDVFYHVIENCKDWRDDDIESSEYADLMNADFSLLKKVRAELVSVINDIDAALEGGKL